MEFYTKLVITGYGVIITCMILELIFTKKISAVDKLFNIKDPVYYYFAIVIYILLACLAVYCVMNLLKLKKFRTFAIILSYLMLISGLISLIGLCILFVALSYKYRPDNL
jgi:hypothetical protein